MLYNRILRNSLVAQINDTARLINNRLSRRVHCPTSGRKPVAEMFSSYYRREDRSRFCSLRNEDLFSSRTRRDDAPVRFPNSFALTDCIRSTSLRMNVGPSSCIVKPNFFW